MSWITPTTTWTDSDTPLDSDFNRIENNTDYLKDAVDTEVSDRASADTTLENAITSSGSSITVLEGTGTPQGVGTSDSPTFAGLTLTGALLPDSTPTSGSQAVLSGANDVLSRGVWNIIMIPAVGTAYLELYISGAWRIMQSSTTSQGCCVFSDGTNARIRASGGNITYYYQKF